MEQLHSQASSGLHIHAWYYVAQEVRGRNLSANASISCELVGICIPYLTILLVCSVWDKA